MRTRVSKTKLECGECPRRAERRLLKRGRSPRPGGEMCRLAPPPGFPEIAAGVAAHHSTGLWIRFCRQTVALVLPCGVQDERRRASLYLVLPHPRGRPLAVFTLVLDNNTQERDGEQAWAHHCHMRPPETPKQVPLRREPSFEKEPSDLGLGSP